MRDGHRRRGRRLYHPRRRRRVKRRDGDPTGRQASDREKRGIDPLSRRTGRRIPAEKGAPSGERGQSSPRDGGTVDQGTHERTRPKVLITTVKDKRWRSPLRGGRKEMFPIMDPPHPRHHLPHTPGQHRAVSLSRWIRK